ncbi:MAG: thioether cross-link-forming SCIFF peptide maturase, partial [Clostridia bacterium]|nr:thioether cross-link-forming SCIFF peptide maturase [Clostridia bacterium]
SELEQLEAEGLLDASAPTNVVAGVKSKEVKALCVHMSHDCNLRCKYCFAGTGAYHGERMHMSLEVAKASIDFLIANSGNRRNLEVDFFGGEPLMNLDVLKQTVEYAKEQAKLHNKVFKFTTTTNGVLLDKETSDYLNAEMENVVLSLDGRKEINDFHRPTVNGKGSFDVIVDKYKYFRSIRGDKSYYIRGTFTGANANFYDDVIAMADLGFDQVSVEPVVLPSDHELAIKPEQLQTICDNYEKLAVEYVKRRADEKTWFSFFHFVVDLENGPCYKKRLVGCGAGSEYMAITPDGSIYPCHQFAGEKDFLLGNVFDKTLDEDKRNFFRESNLTTKTICSDCWAKYHCSGGCAANAVHFNGNINQPYEIACAMMKKRLECALYVYAKERKNS